MRPMTIVVVRDEPAGGSGAGAAAVVAGAADAVVAGAGAAVSGAAAVVAGAAAPVVAAVAGAAGPAVDWANPADAARRVASRTAVSPYRRFIIGKLSVAPRRVKRMGGRVNRGRDLLRLDAAVFLSGAALMGLEIVGSRVLAPVFGTSLFVWGALITTFLAALAAGYALGGRLADRRPDPSLLAAVLFGAGVLVIVLFAAPDFVLAAASAAPVPDRFRALLAARRAVRPAERPHGRRDAFRRAPRRQGARARRLGGGAALAAVSTTGSILGAFSTAFFLIPTFATRPHPVRARHGAPRRGAC